VKVFDSKSALSDTHAAVDDDSYWYFFLYSYIL